ncbi:MAG: hypothetical protein AAAC48_17005, partial [Phyllobacterium sp.]|uniref:hypothetical protein n=1 Tax=Phyllobacterium sp. TaxID=1871046 RepID=UPI0030F29637
MAAILINGQCCRDPTCYPSRMVEYSSNTARGGKQVRTIFRSPWFGRGLRLAVIIGLVAAAWHAWGVWKRFSDDSQTSIKRELTYECAARLPEDALNQHVNEFGNINVKTLCFTEGDFFVAPYELEAVRNGTMNSRRYGNRSIGLALSLPGFFGRSGAGIPTWPYVTFLFAGDRCNDLFVPLTLIKNSYHVASKTGSSQWSSASKERRAVPSTIKA